MAIAVTCGSCRTTFQVKDEFEGKRGKCPRCQALMDVPQLLDVLEEELPIIDAPLREKTRLTQRDIRDAFEEDIEPVKRTAAYGMGILILSCVMLVLPAIYLLFVSGIACLLFYHATFNAAAIFRTKHWGPILFFYIAPLFIGVIVLFFLVKPVFARRARKYKLRTIEFEEAPLMYALVSRVAEAVGAPEPKRIDIDGEVNASARFGSVFGVLFGGDLVLTIGLPLVAGLTIEELAGVIAHELGHFTQGMGMRLSYVVRSINAWFARIALEGDDWDEALARACQEIDFRIGFILYAALLCIWLTRWVFWLLMVIGHVLSCYLLRQMEFDADRSEARLAGASVFFETSRKLLLLQLASNSAYGAASLSWYKKGKVPDDLSALILRISEQIPEKEFRKIEKEMKRSEASFFDTHPSHGERLASVRDENAPGVFRLDGPAPFLFQDFAKLSRAVSLQFHRTVIGKRVKRDCLVPVGVFLGEEKEEVRSKAEIRSKGSEGTYDFAP